VIAQASQHFVTPMMAPPLVDNADAPSDVRDYFAAVQTLTTQQGEVLLVLSAEIVSALRAIGARPVLLKGAATLGQGLYPARGVRLMTDIDVLVFDTKMKEVNNALAMRGYHRGRQLIIPESPPHHDAAVTHEHTGVRVEVHRALCLPEFAGLLPAHEALDRAVPVSANGMAFSVLDPTDRIVHHILHAQLHHEGDLAVLVDALGDEIDWKDVEARFAKNGYATALADYLAYLAILLGRRVPAHVSELEAVMGHLRAGVEAHRIPRPRERVGALAADYWKSFRRQPALAINLIDPRFWPERLRRWRHRLRPGPF
jgi:HAMP domain-containing protein